LGDRQLAGLQEFARRISPRLGLAPFGQPVFADV
jgi:hypothetical protein